MCHPPLVCPLCSSAGGFPSPGALWLGLIGVANRLLSCPVCHELLLGLDKLTIHLVSHVPDLNLLASTIGNYVCSNQKVIHEFEGAEPCIKKLQNSNNTFDENASHQNHYLSPKITCKSYDRTQKCTDQVKTSDTNTNISGVSKSNETEKETPSIKTSCFSNNFCHQRIEGGSRGKGSQPIGMKDTCTQTVKGLEQQNDSGNHTTKKAISKLRTKYSSEEKNFSDQYLPYSASQKSGSIIFSNFTDNEDKPNIQTQCNSPPSTSTKESISKPLKRSNVVFTPSNIYSTQTTKNSLQQDREKKPTYEEQPERLRNTLRGGMFGCNDKTTRYQCSDCNMVFDDPRCLSLHHIMIHSSTDESQPLTCLTISSQSVTNFPCQLCNRKLVSKGALLVHMRFAHNIVPGIFLDSEFGKQGEGSVIKPNEETNELSDVLQPKFGDSSNPKCSLLSSHQIDVNFPGKPEEKSLIVSVKEKKELMDFLVEGQCEVKDNNELIGTENSLDINKDDNSNGSSPRQCLADEEMKHSCKICEAQFSSVMELIAHRPAHSEDDGYICVVCGKTFKKEQHLQQHLRTHEGKQWECDVCSKFFTTKYFLKKHKRLHTGEMPYSCETCGKTFTFQQSYHKHLLYHSDEKPHACGECGKRFKELSTLHNHERIHTGEKPFTCESCGKAFRQRVSYLVHRRIHTGVMPYKCTACEKSFRYKVSQRTHKCSSQQTGTVVRQSSDLVERLLLHQKDKPSVNDCSGVGEVLFSVAVAESLSNQSSCQHSNEALQELPTFPHTTNALNDQNADSYSIASTSLQAFPTHKPTMESQGLSNSFSLSKTAIVVQEQEMPSNSASSLSITITSKENPARETFSDYCSQILKKGNESKNTEPLPDKIEIKFPNTNELESSSEHSSDSAKLKFTSQSENHQDKRIKRRESLFKINEIRGNSNTEGEEMFNHTLFSNAAHMIDPAETDFFAMVMSPAEPALEQMGKLTISSLQGPEKENSVYTYQDKKQFGIFNEESNSQSQPPISPAEEVQKSLSHYDKSSKNDISQANTPPSHREQESTANAADLSSFLQCCFEQWNSTNIISNEKPKEVLQPQHQYHQSAKHDHCLGDSQDNRLQTINEESLKKLLYGDSAS